MKLLIFTLPLIPAWAILKSQSRLNFYPEVPRITLPTTIASQGLYPTTRINTTGDGYFDQQLDHKNSGRGTFKQRFWWNTENWRGPGSPVVFLCPGESAAEEYAEYLNNGSIWALYAQNLGAATVMLEHRYYGDSSPYDVLTAETLQFLTTDQVISDITRFAREVRLPFDKSHRSNAHKVPWVFVSGSYAGNLASWTESIAPGTFWAYHASSAPLQAIKDFWQFWHPIQQGMPKNCSADISRVVDYMDNIFTKGTQQEQLELKKLFGLESVKNPVDIMAAISWDLSYWQNTRFDTGYDVFYQFCDGIEDVQAGALVTPNENGVGLDKALARYANYSNEILVPFYCNRFGLPDGNMSCFDTSDPNNPMYTSRGVRNHDILQWRWSVCNEPFGWWQTGEPRSRPTIRSRLVTAEWYIQQCDLYFPTVNGFTYGSKDSRIDVEGTNKRTKGWNPVNKRRVLYVDGEFDAWRSGSVNSEFRPGGPLQSTRDIPVIMIPGGSHCTDLWREQWEANAVLKGLVDGMVDQMVKWVDQYPKER